MPKTFHLVINPKALEFYEDIKTYITGLKTFTYLHVVEHIGQSEKHYHALCQFSENIKKLSTKKLHGAHIKPNTFGNTDQIKDYIDCKDNHPNHVGVTAVLIDDIGEYKYMGVSTLKDSSCESLLGVKRATDLPDWRMINAWKALKIDERSRITVANWKKNIEVYWIQGPSAIGKSEKAWELVKTWYLDHGIENEEDMLFDELKYNSKSGFYLGVDLGNDTKVAVFDDFRARMLPEEFVNLVDYRRHKLEIKGGHIVNNYELIIFTSVQHFSRIYGNVDDYEARTQWTRRVTVIDLYKGKEPDNESVTSNVSHDTVCFYCKHNVLGQCNCNYFNK